MADRRTFSITMKKETKATLDQMVRDGDFGGRSQAIEHYVHKGIEAERQEREFLLREKNLQQLSKEKLDFMLEYFEAIEGNPELKEKMREAIRELQGR
jgi:Arc/MetJ-type ribon-helix-helix transcriptional regulator